MLIYYSISVKKSLSLMSITTLNWM